MFRPTHDTSVRRLLTSTAEASDRLTAAVTRIAPDRVLLPWLLVTLVAFDDAFLLPRAPSYAVLGLFDEPAHLATSLILLLTVTAVAVRAGLPSRTGCRTAPPCG